jgi:beta-hydroxylase
VAGQQVFLPTDHIEWVTQLESHWRVIRDELDQLRARYAMPALIDVIAGERGVADARWKAFLFCYFGREIERNCSLCPRTAALLRGIPGLLSAEFSVLEPGARIAPHHGIYAGTLRYHLGLIVPQRGELCGLRVEDETRRWGEGASLLFDDTRRHEAWNLAQEDRVVLLVDVKRRLPAPLRWLNDALLLVLSRLVMPPLIRVDRAVPPLAGAPAAGSAAQPLTTD